MKKSPDVNREIIIKLIEKKAKKPEDLRRLMAQVYGRYQKKGFERIVALRQKYNEMIQRGEIKPSATIERLLVTKKVRSLSGVSVITVLTKPWPCPGKCIYCPTEKNVPQSYLSCEPAVMRAILNEYDPNEQIRTRLTSLDLQGHPTNKVEIIVIGGTFSALPRDYQEDFILGIFNGLNNHDASDLGVAQELNEKAKHRCVGLTLETRPDYITKEEIEHFRYLGATRVELGVQSIYDEVLLANKRGHKVAATIKATQLLKDAGFKICYHLMPGLYGSTYQKDLKMFEEVFKNPDFRPDYIKIYPTVVTANTELHKLSQKGEYKSYTDEQLINLISKVKSKIPYYVRVMRTIRDIPATSIVAGSKTSNLRQIVLKKLSEQGRSCECIRCREVGLKNKNINFGDIQLFTEKYEASGGVEYFLSFETQDRKALLSLLRLRLTQNQYLDELKGAALVRELHTYGQEIYFGQKGRVQHLGLGKALLSQAEEIALKNGFAKMAVIAAVGTRQYYQKFGYELEGSYMVKKLKKS